MSVITRERVLAALSQVEEPDLKKDLVTLGMIRDLHVDGTRVVFTVVLTTPACPLKDAIRNACVTAIHTLVSREAEVEVNMTANVTAQAVTGPNALPGVKNVIAVASGKGGVGKSTVAANLAVALALQGSRVGLLDADIYGPSVPIMFGLVDEAPDVHEVDGKQRMVPLVRYGVQIMSIGFLVGADKSIVWRGPMASNAFRQLAADTEWNDLDYLVVDLPPGTGDIHITLSQQFPLTGAVIVTTPQPVAVADARKAIGMFVSPGVHIPVLGIVENMAYFSPPDQPDRRYHLFGQGGGAALANEFNLPLLAEIPLVEAAREAADTGSPIVLDETSPLGKAFAQLAQAVAQQVSIVNAKALQTA